MTEMLSQEDYTIVKNTGKENMEIITKEGERIDRYTPSEDQDSKSGKRGKKVGIAYELENGEIIYVPMQKVASLMSFIYDIWRFGIQMQSLNIS